jgi:hypothetical protein
VLAALKKILLHEPESIKTATGRLPGVIQRWMHSPQ